MKKISILLMLMALFGPLAMNADEVTVNGTSTTNNSYVPVYGLYADYGCKSQFIIPSESLSGIPAGSTISKLTFYHTATSAVNFFGTSAKVEVGEVSNSSFSSTAFVTSGLTTVYSGTSLTRKADGTMEVSFSPTYTYNGGNLLISIGGYGSGYSSTSWVCASVSNATVYGYNSSSGTIPTSAKSVISYAPKTTITYTPASGSCASGCECFENCTALTGTGSGDSGSTPAANLPTNWKGYGADYYPFAATFTSYMGSSADGNFMYFKATDSNATYLALPDQYVTQVNFDYAYETNAYGTNGDALQLEIGYMTDISSSTWYNNTFYSLKTMTNNGDTWGSESADFSSVTASTYYVVFKFSQTQGSWYSAAIDNVCLTTNAPDPCDKTIPYTYGFEDATEFSCWSTVDCETDTQQGLSGIVNYGPNSGTYAFWFSSYCGNTNPQYLISPKLRGVANGVHVEFYYKNLANAPETFQVGYSTTDNNVSSFTWVDSKTSTAETYQHFTANYMGNVKYVAVKYTTADSYYLAIDDFTIEEAPSCLEPTNVTASNETTTSATISWTAGGSETEWDLYYTSNPSDVPTASTTPSFSGITTTYQNLTNLSPATTYYVYVRAQCTETSAWSTPGIFNTECNGMALPYTYGFEDGALSVCWNIINDSQVYMDANVSTSSANSGSYKLDLRRGTSNGNQIVVLPEVDATYALSNYEVSFYAMLYAATSNETATNRTLAVGVMTDPDDASTFVQVGSAVTPTSSYAQYTFDLSSYTGNGQYFAIKHTSTSNGHTYIDDLQITALPCPVPSGLSATNITAASATLGWTGDQSSYKVQYRSYVQGEPQVVNEEEGFEGGSLPTGWDNSSYTGAQWKIGTGTGHTSSSYTATTSAATGSYNAYYYSGTSSNSAYLITPALNLANASGATLTFNYVNPAWSGGYYNLKVYYRVNGGSWTELANYITSQNTWTEKTVTLTGLADNYQVAFYVTGYASDYGHGVGIDDVKFSYTAQSITYGTLMTVNPATSPLNIEGLTPMTNYEWQVQGLDCDGNGTPTNWSTLATFSTPEGYIKHIGAWTSTGGWYLITSPLADATNPTDVANMIPETAANYDLYRFNQNPEHTDDGILEWINYKDKNFEVNEEFGSLEAGTGYLYANASAVDLIFTGSAYNDNGEITLEYDNTNNPDSNMHGWNLVGNPFTVAAGVDHQYYIMNGDRTDIMVGTGNVGAMDGIFVRATASGQKVKFTPSSSKGNTTTNGESVMINLSKNQQVIDRAVVSFDEDQQLPKFQLFENSTKIYIPVDGVDYAVVSSKGIGELPFSFKAEENGTYTLSLNSEGMNLGYLHLIDNMTGNDVDVLVNPSYSFEARTTDYSQRFKLVFATGDNTNDNFAFFSNGSFVINNDGNATLQVIDITGRILKSESINGCTNLNFNAAPGVYMIRLINGTDVKVQKVVVK